MSHTEFVVDSQGRLREVAEAPTHPPVDPLAGPAPARSPLFDLPAGPATRFEVTFDDGRSTVVEGADAYQPEGNLITFFATGSARAEIDSWSRRVASYRSSMVMSIQRLAPSDTSGTSEGRHLVAV